MITTLLLGAIIGASLGSPIANVWLSPVGPLSPLRQFHAQDGSGAYQYSFTGPHHAKSESTLNGITQGGYSYIDANGILQTVAYTADDQHGFRVSASNLPQPPKNELTAAHDIPEVAAAKRNHLEELQRSHLRDPANLYNHNVVSYKILPRYVSYAEIRPDEGKGEQTSKLQQLEGPKNPFLLSQAEADSIEVPTPDPSLSRTPPPAPLSSSPARVGEQRPSSSEARSASRNSHDQLVALPSARRPIALPAPYVLPVLPYRLLHSSLHHTQDSLGQYDYTYTGDSSAKTESRSLDGTTRGAYSYIDPNGVLQQVHYIADHNGFRVTATNLPEAK